MELFDPSSVRRPVSAVASFTMQTAYAHEEPTRAEVDALRGPTVIEFGASWCGICQATQPMLETALAGHPQLRHFKIEDARGKRLGRSFGVKLWPTLVFLSDGQEVARLVRPTDAEAIADALSAIDGPRPPR